MAALDRYGDIVDPNTARRGTRYFLQGRVRDLRFDGYVARARVAGTIDYDTRVRFEPDGGLATMCTCEGYELQEGFCKHVYALILAVDRLREERARGNEASWRALTIHDEAPPERDVRYRVRVEKSAADPVCIEALTPRVKGGDRIVRLREVPALRPSDRALIDIVTGSTAWNWRDDTRLDGARAALVLPVIAQTGRATITVDHDEETPLVFDAGPPWRFGVSCVSDGAALKVTGELVRGDEHVALDAPRVLLSSGVVLMGERLARVEVPSFAWVRALREKTMRVAEADVEDFAEFAATAPFSISLPHRLRYVRVTGSPKLVVRLAAKSSRGITATALFEYDGKRVHGQGAVVDRAARRIWSRDEAAEERWHDSMREAGFRVSSADITITSQRLPRAVRELMALGARVEGERGAIFRAATRFSSRVSSGIDWLDLEAAAHFGEESVALPAMLAAARRGESTIALGDGSLAILPEEWLARFSLYGELGHANGDSIRFRRGQVAIVDALLEALPEIECDAAAQKLRAAVRSKPEARSAPKAFSGELRAYQCEGLGWLRWLEQSKLGGCLADDMGLGKTVQVLAHLAGRRSKKPSIVVAPRSVIFNWKSEAARFAPRLRVLEHVGGARDAARIAGADVVLTTYGTLRRDIEALASIDFDYAILDEAQAIKNRGSVSAKAARLLRADHRLALTGTPVENHIRELGSLFAFIEPGLLDGPALDRLDQRDGSEVRSALARILRPFVLRRTKAEVARDLPDRIEQTRFVDLEASERARYTQLRDHFRKRILQTHGGAKPINVLEAILRLRQAACHPALVDETARGEPSAKLDALLAHLEEVTGAGHKALVFSQFTSLLAIVRQRLDDAGVAYEYLDGQTRDRKSCVERFQDASGPKVFLISLKAGGLGLNLTAAEYVFLLDPWWNPAVEAQAIDRAHRIGQTRTVMAYRIIARDTIEERVLTLQATKRALFESLFGDGAAMGSLTAEDIDLLLS